MQTPHVMDITSAQLYRRYLLAVPTYDGSGQAVHPDILVSDTFPRYVLSFTPYPHTQDTYENPSILISDDGAFFREEKSGLNPIVFAPETDHNDDPDLFLENGSFCIVYLETLRPYRQNLNLLQSSDRCIWKKKTLFTENMTSPQRLFMLSPAYIRTENGVYLYYVNGSNPDKRSIEYFCGKDVNSFDFTVHDKAIIDGFLLNPWHIDIIRGTNTYFMLLSCIERKNGKNSFTLHLAYGKNGIGWKFIDKPVLPNCYRSSGFIKDGIMYIYYSHNVVYDEWYLGLYKIQLSDFFPSGVN